MERGTSGASSGLQVDRCRRHAECDRGERSQRHVGRAAENSTHRHRSSLLTTPIDQCAAPTAYAVDQPVRCGSSARSEGIVPQFGADVEQTVHGDRHTRSRRVSANDRFARILAVGDRAAGYDQAPGVPVVGSPALGR